MAEGKILFDQKKVAGMSAQDAISYLKDELNRVMHLSNDLADRVTEAELKFHEVYTKYATTIGQYSELMQFHNQVCQELLRLGFDVQSAGRNAIVGDKDLKSNLDLVKVYKALDDKVIKIYKIPEILNPNNPTGAPQTEPTSKE